MEILSFVGSLAGSLLIGSAFFWLSSKELRNQTDRLASLISALERIQRDPRKRPILDEKGMMTGSTEQDERLGGRQPAGEGTLTTEKNREP
jgi:hypothetical protein